MPQATNQVSAVQAQEVLTHVFDWSTSGAIAAGTTLQSIVSVTLTQGIGGRGQDPNPASRINGSPILSGFQVLVSIGPLVADVNYVRSAIVQASDGQRYELYCTFYSAP